MSSKILQILSEKNLFDLVDGPKSIKNFLQNQIEGKSGFWLDFIWHFCSIYFSLKKRLGLNPGHNLQIWISDYLQKEGIHTYKDLQNRRQHLPVLKHRHLVIKKIPEPRLAIVTSEVTTHIKVELPAMAHLYWREGNKVPPADFVRASMSIPIFYEPYIKKDVPGKGSLAHPEWIKYAGYYGEVPPAVKFVDGGLLSNFPINIFHRKGVPSRPSFGVRLSTHRENFSDTEGFFSYSWAIIGTMRQIHDYDFILKNPDYRKLICAINADEKFNWLNVNMSRKRQKELFLLGAQKGIEFLENFDWESYKDIRQKI